MVLQLDVPAEGRKDKKMNEIVMLPVGQLYHHPENPRKDLGDLSELAESIRKNGIMQNLTVISGRWRDKDEYIRDCQAEGVTKEAALGTYDSENSWTADGYTVVIGNRRMEAAKLAGMEELPCVISDMDHKTQIATMLEENMQRADLTVYEQAQGFQMMMDLGYTAKDISEKTGFGETTVRRRLKMAEMDPKLLKKACEAKDTERQITLLDFEKLAQVNSVKERNALLKDIGERNFDWNLNRALRRQRISAVQKDAEKELKDAGVIVLQEKDEYSSSYERIWGGTDVDLSDWEPGKKLIPKNEKQLYYFINDGNVKFYTKAEKKKEETPKKTAAEIEKEKKVENAWKIADRITAAAAERRLEFVNGMTVKPSNAMQMLRWAIIAGMSDSMDHNYNKYNQLKKMFELQGTYRWDLVDGLQKQILEMKQSSLPLMIMIMFEGLPEPPKEYESFASGYRKEMPQHIRNTRLEQCYAWLTEFGYQMSDEEIQMMGGNHPVFGEVKA